MGAVRMLRPEVPSGAEGDRTQITAAQFTALAVRMRGTVKNVVGQMGGRDWEGLVGPLATQPSWRSELRAALRAGREIQQSLGRDALSQQTNI